MVTKYSPTCSSVNDTCPPKKFWGQKSNKKFKRGQPSKKIISRDILCSQIFLLIKEKYVKKWWILGILKDMQTQITKTYQITAVRMAISKNGANNKCWSDCGEMHTLGSKGDVVKVTNKNTLEVLWKSKHWVTSPSITPTAGPITRENENQKVTGWQSCTPAIFTIGNTWKQRKCPSTEECTKKWSMTYIYYQMCGKQPHSTGRSARCFVTT